MAKIGLPKGSGKRRKVREKSVKSQGILKWILSGNPDYCYPASRPWCMYFQYKIWLKPSAEQQYLYGHHVMKSGLGRITENTPQYQGVIVYNMADLPLVIIFTHP